MPGLYTVWRKIHHFCSWLTILGRKDDLSVGLQKIVLPLSLKIVIRTHQRHWSDIRKNGCQIRNQRPKINQVWLVSEKNYIFGVDQCFCSIWVIIVPSLSWFSTGGVFSTKVFQKCTVGYICWICIAFRAYPKLFVKIKSCIIDVQKVVEDMVRLDSNSSQTLGQEIATCNYLQEKRPGRRGTVSPSTCHACFSVS